MYSSSASRTNWLKGNPFMNLQQKQAEEAKLLATMREELPRLEGLLQSVNGHWACEDLVYRFYHQSFKVFGLQGLTKNVVDALQSLAPICP